MCPLYPGTRLLAVPTGVPILDLNARLLAAATQVLRQDGPAALTSRAVTLQAGVAKGLLHRRYADFDAFLGALVASRIDALEDPATDLNSRAGEGTVSDNVVRYLVRALDADARATIALIGARPTLRARATTSPLPPILAEVTRALAAYLTAERGLGRIGLEADVDRLAMALAGTASLVLDAGLADELPLAIATITSARA